MRGMQSFSLYAWFISLNTVSTSSTPVAAYETIPIVIHTFFRYSSTDGYLGWFQILPPWTLLLACDCRCLFRISSMETAGSWSSSISKLGVFCLFWFCCFWGIAMLFSIMNILTYSLNRIWVSYSPPPSSLVSYCRVVHISLMWCWEVFKLILT